MRPARFNSETPGVKCCRVILYVANDNRITHREDLPTSEELTEWVREAIVEGDLSLHELIPPEAIEVRWSEPAHETV